jgi:hypothetical protein
MTQDKAKQDLSGDSRQAVCRYYYSRRLIGRWWRQFGKTGNVTIHGDVVGRDKLRLLTTTGIDAAALVELLKALRTSIVYRCAQEDPSVGDE